MKTFCKHLTLAVALCAGLINLHAAETKIAGGPKGGRLIEKTEPKLEFLLENDHTATVTFYDATLKPIPVTNQSVTLIANAPSGKATIEFAKQGDILTSKTNLPAGDGYDVVLQLKATADAKPQNFRFKLITATCGECKRAEYACICGH